MKTLLLIIVWAILAQGLSTSILMNLDVILEKKFLQKHKLNVKAEISSFVKRNSENIYESNENGIHFISLNQNFQIFHEEIIQVQNQNHCIQEFKKRLGTLNTDPLIIVSLDNWENCLDWDLITLLHLTPESYDLRLLMGGKAGVGHAFVYFTFRQQTFLKISHENNFVGMFQVSLADFLINIDDSKRISPKKLRKIKTHEVMNDLRGRFAETTASNNSDYYNVSIDAEVKLNFTTDQNITGSNTLYQVLKLNVPKNSSNSSSFSSLSSLNASQSSSNSAALQNISNLSFLPKEFQLKSHDIKGIKGNNQTSLIKQNFTSNNQNFSKSVGKSSSKTFDIEMVSYGSQTTDSDFASIKINQQLIHASKSCGLHVAVFDPCRGSDFDSNENMTKIQNPLENLTNFYKEIKFLYKNPLKIITVSCFDTFRSANVVGGIFDFSDDLESLSQVDGSALINCPGFCPYPEEIDKIYNPEKLYLLDEEICTSAIKSKVVDGRGGIFLLKAIDLSSLDYFNILSNFKAKSDPEKFKFKLLKYRITRNLWSFPRNMTDDNKTAIKLKISSMVQEVLENATQSDIIDSEQMSILEKNFDFHEDTLSFLPKFLKAYFSDQSSMAHMLESLLEEKRYSSYFKIIQQSNLFSPSFAPFLGEKIQERKQMERYRKELMNDVDDSVIFTKTFYICEDYEDIYRSEGYQLKHLLENLSPEWKILITSQGLWISGVDESLIQDLLMVGAPQQLSSFYLDSRTDLTKNDISLSFLGGINLESQMNLSKIQRKDPNSHQDLEYFNPSRSILKISFKGNDDCPTLPKNQSLDNKNIDKSCASWVCKFFSIFQNELNSLDLNLSSNENNPIFDKTLFLKQVAGIFSNSQEMISLEQLSGNPLALSQYLFDLPLDVPANPFGNSSCILEIESNTPDSYSLISFRSIQKRISDLNENNSILLMVIDNSCQRNFLRTRTFKSTTDDFINLNRFLQEQDPGSILALVQYGFYDWRFVRNSSLLEIFQYYGLVDLNDLPNSLMNSNMAFVGKKGMKNSGLLAFSLNAKASISVNICNHTLFSQCESQILYIRSVGNTYTDNSPINQRVIFLNNQLVTKNEKRGISLTLMVCPENYDENEESNGNYRKVWEKNFDLWSEGELLADLNKNLRELISKNYFGKPLFIVSSYGNYDFYVSDDTDWSQFNYFLERLGGSSFNSYLKQKNTIYVNGKSQDIGHPFILVGSPKFNDLEAFEYHFPSITEKSANSNDLNVELMIDLNEKKLNCPLPTNKIQALRESQEGMNFEKRMNSTLSNLDSKLNQQMPRILHYKKSPRFSFKEIQQEVPLTGKNFDWESRNSPKIDWSNEDTSNDDFIQALTQAYLKSSKAHAIHERENSTNKSLFPSTPHQLSNPCIHIQNESSKNLSQQHQNESKTDLIENVTYNLFIRGLIIDESTDQIKNLVYQSNYLCGSEIKSYGIDSFEKEKLSESMRNNYGSLALKMYKCQTSNKPPTGEYTLNLITKKGNRLHNIIVEISKINSLNYELRISA